MEATGTTRRSCTGVKADGSPCHAPALKGSAFCHWHSLKAPARRRHIVALESGSLVTLTLHTPPATPWPPDPNAPSATEQTRALADALAAIAREFVTSNASPGAQAHIEYDDDAGAVLVELVQIARWDQPISDPPALTRDLPAELPQITCEEPRALLEAVANGRTGNGWDKTEDEKGLFFFWRHPQRPKGHEVRLRPYDPPEIWGRAAIERKLSATLQDWDLTTAYIAAVTISGLAMATLAHTAGIASGAAAPVIDLDIDQALRALGKRRSDGREKWNSYRRQVRDRLLELSGASVTGARLGTYRAPGSRTKEDTYQEAELFFIHDRETTWLAEQLPLDGSGVPLRLRVYGGGLWRHIARNPRMLQYLGDLRALAKIPSEQTSGQWALAMALSFTQRVRELKTTSPTMTHRDLLMRFPPNPTPQEIAAQGHPARVLTYYRRAKKELVTVKYWRDFPEPKAPDARYGSLDLWLDQEVSPEAGDLLREPVPALAAEAEAAERRARKRTRSRI